MLHYNNKDTAFRYIIASTLAELDNILCIYNVISDTDINKIPIPVFYSQDGQELPYIEDYFDDSKECGATQVLPIPRGVFKVSSIGINQQEETGWAKMSLPISIGGLSVQVDIRGKFIPIKLSASLNIICSTQIELLKVIESTISRLWLRNNAYRVNFSGVPIDAVLALDSASYSRKYPTDITLSTTDREYSTELSLSVVSAIPAFEGGVTFSELMYLLSLLLKDDEKRARIEQHPIVSISTGPKGEMCYACNGLIGKFQVNLYSKEEDSYELIRTETIPNE